MNKIIVTIPLVFLLVAPAAIAQEPGRIFARLCETSTDPDTAIAACSHLIETRDLGAARQAVALTLRAAAWKAKSESKRAIEDLNTAVALDPTLEIALVRRAELLREVKEYKLAIASYDQAIKLAADKPELYLGRALCNVADDDRGRAIADFDTTIRLDAGNKSGLAARAWALKALVFASDNELDRAMSGLDQAIKLDPANGSFFLDRADIWIKKNDDARALADLGQAIKLDSDDRSGVRRASLQVRALIRTRQSETDAALGDLDEAIKLGPRSAALYVDRGAVLIRKGDEARALADYDKAIELEPKNAAYLVVRGDFRRDRGRYDDALKDYGEGIRQGSKYYPAYASRGLTYFYVANFEKAVDDFKYVTDNQANAYSTLMLYVMRTRVSDAQEARNELVLNAAQLKDKGWPRPLVEFYLGKKSPKETEAQARTPQQKCEAKFYIGEWHLQKKDMGEATKALQAAVDTCPKDYVEYRGAVEELKRLK